LSCEYALLLPVLRASELVAHGEHRRPRDSSSVGEQVAHVAAADEVDAGVRGGTLDAVVPRIVVVGAVAIALAVRLVVLRLVADEIRRA
jgi:hypothetical protein